MTLTCAGHFWTAMFIVWNFNPDTHFVAQITEQIQRLDRLITTLLRCPEEDGPATESNHDLWKRENSRTPSYSVSQHDKSDPRRTTIQLAYLCLPQSNAALWGESLLQSVNIETSRQIGSRFLPAKKLFPTVGKVQHVLQIQRFSLLLPDGREDRMLATQSFPIWVGPFKWKRVPSESSSVLIQHFSIPVLLAGWEQVCRVWGLANMDMFLPWSPAQVPAWTRWKRGLRKSWTERVCNKRLRMSFGSTRCY